MYVNFISSQVQLYDHNYSRTCIIMSHEASMSPKGKIISQLASMSPKGQSDVTVYLL